MSDLARTVDQSLADPSLPVWATDRSWDDPRELTDGGRKVIAASSWQDSFLKSFGASAEGTSLVVPQAITPQGFEFDRGRKLSVAFACPIERLPQDVAMTNFALSIFNSVARDNPDAYFYCVGEPSVSLSEIELPVNVQVVSREGYEITGGPLFTHVWIRPALAYRGQDTELLEAMSAGNVVIVPSHSSYQEHAGATGIVVPFSTHLEHFGSAFATILNEVCGHVRDNFEQMENLARMQKSFVDYQFSKEREEYGLAEARAFLDLK